MPTLKSKPGRSANWLPSQVLYGIDCSDSDPKKWTAFGTLHEEEEARKAKVSQAASAKSAPPAQ